MKRALRLMLFLSCSTATLAPARARAEVVDRIVAVIEEDAIFLSELERRLRPFTRQLEQIPDERVRNERREVLFRETLERMVDDALIRRAATRAHVSVTPADVDRMISGLAQQRQASVQDIYDAVEAEGISRTEYRTFMEAEVLRLRVLNVRVRGRVNITAADIQEEYRRRSRQAIDRSPFHVAHIFLAFPENPTGAQVAATRQRADAVVLRLNSGEDFAAVARVASDDTGNRENGGDLGTIDPQDAEQPAPEWLVNAVRSLEVGGVSSVTRGENGYHVFRLLGRETTAIPPLESVRDDLYNELVNREMTRQQRLYMRELRQRSAVEVRL